MTLKIISFQDDSSGNYEALRIEEDRKVDNRFIATMIIDRLEADDFEEENHILRSRSFSFLPAFRRSGFPALWRFGIWDFWQSGVPEFRHSVVLAHNRQNNTTFFSFCIYFNQ